MVRTLATVKHSDSIRAKLFSVRLAQAISLRLLFGVLSLVFISLVTFVAGELTPYDAATIEAGDKGGARVQEIRHRMGLDRPWYVRYVEYVNHSAHGDFGKSFYGTKEDVSAIIARTLPMTARIAFMSITLAAIIGITFGTISGIYSARAPDRAILTLSTLGVTVPKFVLAPVLVYILAVQMGRLPVAWEEPRAAADWYYYILPVCILAARPSALLTRITRSSMIDTLQQEFIRTAIAKGVPRGRLYICHALRNAILPTVTAIGTSFGVLLTGSFVVENAFLLPGIGKQTIEAMTQNNMPVIQACVMVTGLLFILLNLIVDIILPILDPRIRESQI